MYHLAGQPGVRRSWGREFEIYLNENLLATQLLLEAVRDTGVRRFVFASSSSVYGDAESACQRTSPTRRDRFPPTASPSSPASTSATCTSRASTCRPCRFATSRSLGRASDRTWRSPGSSKLRRRTAEIEVFGDGLQSRDFTYVDDAVSATIAAADGGRPGEAYNIAGGAQATVLEVIELLGELLGRGLPVRHLPPVPGDARHTGGDTEKARGDLSYVPRTGLREGLSEQIAARASVRAGSGAGLR